MKMLTRLRLDTICFAPVTTLSSYVILGPVVSNCQGWTKVVDFECLSIAIGHKLNQAPSVRCHATMVNARRNQNDLVTERQNVETGHIGVVKVAGNICRRESHLEKRLVYV